MTIFETIGMVWVIFISTLGTAATFFMAYKACRIIQLHGTLDPKRLMVISGHLIVDRDVNSQIKTYVDHDINSHSHGIKRPLHGQG